MAKSLLTGAKWMTLLMVVNRLSQFLSQLILARLLLPEDFGLLGMAYSAAAFMWFLRHAGIGVVLIQRQRRIDRWTGVGVRFSMVTGLLAGGLLFALAPLCVWFYGEPELFGLMVVLAITMPVEALRTVPVARLKSRYQFKKIAVIQMAESLTILVGAVLMAWCGAKAYAFVLPQLAVYALGAPLLFAASNTPLWGEARRGQWKYLLQGSAWVTLGGLIVQVVNQGDYLVLGKFLGKKEVGVYFVAFTLASQAMNLLTVNIGNVLIPGLAARKNDRSALLGLYRRVVGGMASIGLPACVCLGFSADYVVSFLYDDRYLGAGAVLFWLALGMGFRLVAHTGNYVMQSAGMWRSFAAINALNGLLFLSLILIGVHWGGLLGAAQGVCLFYVMFGFLHVVVSLKVCGYGWRDVLGTLKRFYFGPVLVSVLMGLLLVPFVHWGAGRHWLILPGWCVVGVVWLVYFKVFEKELYAKLAGPLVGRFGRFFFTSK